MFRRRPTPAEAPSPDRERRAPRQRSAPPDIDARLAAIAAGQDGLVTRADLLGVPLTPTAIRGRVRSRKLHVVFRGVYAVGHPALSPRARLRAALLAVGPRGVLSHWTAASLWGVLAADPELIDVLVHGRGPRSRPGLRVHETRRPFVVTHVDGLPVTPCLRTLEDLSSALSPAELARTASEALVRRLVTEPELDAAGITGPDIAPTPSAFARRFLALVRRAGLPRPATEHQIGRYTADFAWPAEKLVVETDGYRFHGHRAAFEHDRRRDAYLLARGWVVMRVTWRRLRDEPLRVAAELARILATRSAL